jgi:hypothetical protein
MLISITPNLIVGSSFNFTISFHITFFYIWLQFQVNQSLERYHNIG